jgi:integrase
VRDAPDIRVRTRRRYEELLRLHVVPELGRKQLQDVTAADVRALLQRLREKPGRGGRPLAAQTIVHVRAVLRRALSVAEADGLVTRNVAKGKGVEPPRVERREVAALTPEQARLIIGAVRDDRLGPLYTVALATGLRQGELLGLRWAD